MSDNPIDEKAAQEWDETVDHVAVTLAASYVPGSEAEKKLLRKLDFRVIVRLPSPGVRGIYG
jgi:hypothetical protein